MKQRMGAAAFSYAYIEVLTPLTFRCIHSGMSVSFVQHTEFAFTSNYYYTTPTLHFPFLVHPCAFCYVC